MQKSRAMFGIRRKLFLSTIAIAILCVPIAFGLAGAPQSQSSPPTATKLSFDVASIREWGKGEAPVGMVMAGVQFSGDRLISRCASLRALVSYAYHLTWAVPVTGFPAWANASCGRTYTDTFAIEATMPAGTTDEQARQMMQTLLADRFKLAVHWDKKDMPIFALIIGKSGFKLKPSDTNNDAPVPPHSVGCPTEDPNCHNIVAGSGPISALASLLSVSAGRPVIDQTGLTGTYNIDLKWAGDTATDSPLPSLPAALREKFGFELKSQVGPVDVLVIEHVEKPSPN